VGASFSFASDSFTLHSSSFFFSVNKSALSLFSCSAARRRAITEVLAERGGEDASESLSSMETAEENAVVAVERGTTVIFISEKVFVDGFGGSELVLGRSMVERSSSLQRLVVQVPSAP